MFSRAVFVSSESLFSVGWLRNRCGYVAFSAETRGDQPPLPAGAITVRSYIGLGATHFSTICEPGNTNRLLWTICTVTSFCDGRRFCLGVVQMNLTVYARIILKL